jgi:Bacteriocin-protection, YdeI or OmpD-Associated/Domain of unknown function (DUF1905)
MKFRATLELHGKTATGIDVPPEVVEGLGSGKRPAVNVTLGGYTYRSTVAPMGGRFLLPVAAEVRAAAGVAAGDTLDVEVTLDTEPRTVEVPADFAAALAGDPVAQKAFDALSYSNQRGIVQSIEGAKTEETRQRRIDKSLTTLNGG